MKKSAIGIVALALAGCGVIGQPQSLEQRLGDAVERFNNDTSSLGKGFEGTTRKARLEGDTLVFMIANLPTGNETYDPHAMRRILRPEMCDDSDFRELIEDGVKIRFELTSNFGKELPAIQFARC